MDTDFFPKRQIKREGETIRIGWKKKKKTNQLYIFKIIKLLYGLIFIK